MGDILKGLDEAAACLRDETFDNCYVDYAGYVNNGRDEILRLRAEIEKLRAENKHFRKAVSNAVDALDKLAKLGNGAYDGNSDGNLIAISAREHAKEALRYNYEIMSQIAQG